MAVTILLVAQRANWLRYRVTHDGAAGDSANITSSGAASPDLETDSLGPSVIKRMSKVVADGYAQFAAGVQTQAKARALWLSNWVGADPGNENTTTAKVRLTRRGNLTGTWTVDANVSAGSPILTISRDAGVAAGVCYVDIEVPQAID